MVKYVSTYTNDTLKTLSAKDLCNDTYGMILYLFFSVFIKAYVVGTINLNCIDLSSGFQQNMPL